MCKLKVQRSQILTENGETIRFVYDEKQDTLDIFLGGNEPSTGVELTEHILLRLDKKAKKAKSLTIRHFSILTERTEYGPRSFPLENLKQLPEDLRELVIRTLMTSPVNRFLKLSHFQVSPTKQVPFAFIEPYHLVSAA